MKLKKSEIIEIIKEVLDEKITDTGYMMNVRDLKKTFKNYQKPEVGTMKKRGLKNPPARPINPKNRFICSSSFLNLR